MANYKFAMIDAGSKWCKIDVHEQRLSQCHFSEFKIQIFRLKKRLVEAYCVVSTD